MKDRRDDLVRKGHVDGSKNVRSVPVTEVDTDAEPVQLWDTWRRSLVGWNALPKKPTLSIRITPSPHLAEGGR